MYVHFSITIILFILLISIPDCPLLPPGSHLSFILSSQLSLPPLLVFFLSHFKMLYIPQIQVHVCTYTCIVEWSPFFDFCLSDSTNMFNKKVYMYTMYMQLNVHWYIVHINIHKAPTYCTCVYMLCVFGDIQHVHCICVCVSKLLWLKI